MKLILPVTMVQPDHKSTNVHSAGFPDGETRGPLRVQFKGKGGVGLSDLGEYADVPRSVFEALLRDASPGSFIHQNLKPFFTYRKLNIQFRVLLVVTEINADPTMEPALPPYDFDSANPWPLGDYDSPELAMRARNAMVAVDDPSPAELSSVFCDPKERTPVTE